MLGLIRRKLNEGLMKRGENFEAKLWLVQFT
jgi:hypothetical protein